jgi:hypothetical protein
MYLNAENVFLLAAREVKKATGTSYIISSSSEDLSPRSSSCLGKLRSNFVGTEFSIHDGGAKQGKQTKGAQSGETWGKDCFGSQCL